ncbi:hypothetical protein, partial [Microcystis sp. M144S2]|uniref:hypothetical protein n=1 Tax=Microcystis sp. M144S2 TaxID=2771147 RepID=UPI002589F2C9
GARGAPLRVLGGLGFLGFFGGGWAHAVRPYGFWGGFLGVFGGGWAHAPLRVLGGLGFLGVSGKIRRCELRSLMMGIDKRFC